MKSRSVILALSGILVYLQLGAQSVDEFSIQARGAWKSQIKDNSFSSNLAAEFFNVQLAGSLTDNISYRIRQRMNIPIDSKNPFRATDLLYIRWQMSPKWFVTAGKNCILIGGYEYDSAPIDVYYYSQFVDNLSQAYAFSVTSGYEFSKGQSLVAQVSNSPLASGPDGSYAFNIAWNGHVYNWWKTVYSCNFVEDEYSRFINYIALGNHFLLGSLAVDFDLFHRASGKQERLFLTDYSFITKIIWTLGKWNLCFKGGHEYNWSGNKDSDGISFDTVIPAGTQYFYGGCGVEYFPLGNDDVRLHLAYFRNNYDRTDNLTLGVKWQLRLKLP